MTNQILKVVDFHTHSLRSDGELCAAELAQRARLKGYEFLGISDHADSSNLEDCVRSAMKAAGDLSEVYPGFTVLPGVELTHVPPSKLEGLISEARKLGAKCVIVHGETPVEPVEPGTNKAAILGGCDVLAHPGFLKDEEVVLAREKGVYLEISARKGHSLTNGLVAKLAQIHGAKLLINSDAHAPGDLLTPEFQRKVALGAGLFQSDYEEIMSGARELAARLAGAFK
jgi:histidinol phosphatase-like PHP family hydrolase